MAANRLLPGPLAHMCWEYQYLKRQLGTPRDSMLDLFEQYCERAYDALEDMEWSWKFAAGKIQDNRAFWLGAGERRSETSRHMRWLANELSFSPNLPGGIETWRRLLNTKTNRTLVGYSGRNESANQPPCLKLYLTLDSCQGEEYRELLQPLHPKLLAEEPPEGARIILSHAVYENGFNYPRAYLFYTQPMFANERVRTYMTNLLGAEAVAVATVHPSCGVALKNDTTDMMGLSFRPTGVELQDHPSWWRSPALTPLLCAAGKVPLLRERLHRVSWITVPMNAAVVGFPFVLPEMNVYVKLRR